MSCHCGYSPCVCHSFAETACSDPGLETSLKHLGGFDNQFCERRLANPSEPGVLWYGTNGWRADANPQVAYQDLAVAEGQLFTGLMVNTSSGFVRRLVPNNGVNGAVFADGSGNFVIQDPATSTIPDPLVVTEVQATYGLFTYLTVSNTLTLPATVEDTIVYNIGLNAALQVVRGTTRTISVAQFYESNSLTSPATPNFTYPANANANVQIGNEIYDPDGIAHVVSQEVVEIDVAGRYTIEWYGQYTGYNINGSNSAGTPHNPGLYLTVGGVIISKGNVQVYQDRNVGGLAYGKVVTDLTAGQQIRVRGNGSMRSNVETGGTGLQGVTLILTKFA